MRLRGIGAAYLRVDAIEAALWSAGVARDQPTGLAAYVVAYTIAKGSLEASAQVREYERWDEPLLTVDTSAASQAERLAGGLRYIAA